MEDITRHEEFCDHQAEVGRLEAENAELKQHVKDLEYTLKLTKEAGSDNYKRVSSALDGAQERIKELEASNEELSNRLNLAYNEIKNGRLDHESTYSANDELCKVNESLNAKISILQDDLQAYKAEAERMEVKLDIIRKTLEL